MLYHNNKCKMNKIEGKKLGDIKVAIRSQLILLI
jgi:hypothetical protein